MSEKALVDKAKAVLAQLDQLHAIDLWTGSVKPKEVETRIAKAVELSSRLEQRVADKEAKELADKLTNASNQASQLFEMVQRLRDCSDWAAALIDMKDVLANMIAPLSLDQTLGFMTDIAKYLVEDLCN